MAAKKTESLSSLLGHKKPAETKKRKAVEEGSAHVMDKRPLQQPAPSYHQQWGNKQADFRPGTSAQLASQAPQAKQKKEQKPHQKSTHGGKNSAGGAGA